MTRRIAVLLVLLVSEVSASAQLRQPAPGPDTFEVATVKQVGPDDKAGRFLRMQRANRFVAKNYTIKLLLAAAFDLTSSAISGGPAWMDKDHYDIEQLPREITARPATSRC